MAAKEKDTEKSEAPAAGGSKKKIILLALIGLALVGISIGGTIAVVKSMSPPAQEEHPAEEAHAADTHAAQPAYTDLKPAFVVNFQADGRTRYLQIEVSLLTMDHAATEEMAVHLPLIRNTLLMVLNQQDFNLLQTVAGKEALRAEMLARVRELLEREIQKPAVEQVFFTAFVMQ